MALVIRERQFVHEAEELRAAVIEAVTAEPEILAAYLFGSQNRGTAGPLSDVDVALLGRGLSETDEAVARVTDALSRRLGPTPVDVVSLAAAPMPLRFRVVREGSLLLCRDAAVLQRFVVDTVMHYLDFEPLGARAFATMRSAILETR